MTTDLKAKLTGAQWRHHSNRVLKLEGGEELELVIRRPPETVLMGIFEVAKSAGEVNENKEPTSEWNSLRLLARLTIACLFAPGAIRPLFTQAEVDDVLHAPWLVEIQEDVQSAMSPGTKLVEEAKGNSGGDADLSYSVGVAIRLGVRPREVLGWSMEEVALVAAYCELEAEAFKAGSSAPRSGTQSGGSGQVVTSTQVFGNKTKRK